MPTKSSLNLSQAAKNGVTYVVRSPFKTPDGKVRKPTPTELRDLERMYGASLIIDDLEKPIPAKPRKVRGLVIHLIDPSQGMRTYLGDLNLYQQGALFDQVAADKWKEYEVVSRFHPTAMPTTWLARDLIKSSSERRSFYQTRTRLAGALDRFVQSKSSTCSKSLHEITRALVAQFFKMVQRTCPAGAFVKNSEEQGTGDSQQLLHVPKIQADDVANSFVKELERAKAESHGNVKSFGSPVLLEALHRTEVSAAKLMENLVFDTSRILAQQAVKIARTRDGDPAEVRVDFTPAGPIAAHQRYSWDVKIDYVQKALKFFNEFWAIAPAEVRELSGGADVAILEDGSATIIEFNFGNDSGFLDASGEIIAANLFLSKLLARPTPLIRLLEKVLLSDLQTQIRFFSKTIPRPKADSEYHHSLRDLYLPDVFQHLRDRMIERWLEEPTAEGAARLTKRFRAWADSQSRRLTPEMKVMMQELTVQGTEYLKLKLKEKKRGFTRSADRSKFEAANKNGDPEAWTRA